MCQSVANLRRNLASLLRSYRLRLLPPRPPGCRNPHLQRRSRGTRRTPEGDRAGQGGPAQGQG